MVLRTRAAPPTVSALRQHKRPRNMGPPFLLMVPSLLLLVAIIFIPSLFALYISFTRLNQYTIAHWLNAPFVGLKNYIDGLNPSGPLGGTLLHSIRASLLFSLLTTLFITPLGVGAALLLNGSLRGQRLLRAIVLLPYIIPTFVNALVWRLIFLPHGVATRVLSALGLSTPDSYWLIGGKSFWAMIIADVWAAWPFIYLMTLAALQTISHELYDAAAIDGASGPRAFFSITLPLIWPTLSLALLLSTINHLNNFTLPFVMFGTNPPDPVNVLPLNVYIHSFVIFNFGLGAAMAVVMLIVMLLPAVLYIRATRLGEEGLA
ncbi:MAG: sugar ABC transporter permease [Thermorudis peleae]|nr:sugar ABC transporter permease [Thermorudis peleae]